MKKYTSIKNSGFSRLGLILILPFLVLGAAYIAYKLFFAPAPVVNGLNDLAVLSANNVFRLSSENATSVNITIYQGGKEINLLDDKPETGEKAYNLEVLPGELGLKDGKALITVKAASGIFRKVQSDIETVIDTVPPVLNIVRAPSLILQGSGRLARFNASGETSVVIRLVDRSGKTADREFSAFKVKSDSSADGGSLISTYYTFFPAPFDSAEGSVFYAVATDAAGNETIRSMPTRIKKVKFSQSIIAIDDSFINRVILPLLNETSVEDREAAFKKVNEGMRQASAEKLRQLSEGSEAGFLWKGRFLQLRNSKVMAAYGDRRAYTYKRKKISKSVHLGYDLASYANAPVGAANSGRVIYAGSLSIYGNAVILDHGFGLMTLYGHLSSIMVNKGQEVKKGEVIARTGSTGLAGGDHLHFGVLVHGYAVSPLYLWDANWIRLNITSYIDG